MRDFPVRAKIKNGQIIAEQKLSGIIFSFPAAVWPTQKLKRLEWVTRLTPWWDMGAADWSPQAQRLRESCINSINEKIHQSNNPSQTL